MSSPEGEKVVCAKYMFELVLKDSSLFLPEAGGGGWLAKREFGKVYIAYAAVRELH